MEGGQAMTGSQRTKAAHHSGAVASLERYLSPGLKLPQIPLDHADVQSALAQQVLCNVTLALALLRQIVGRSALPQANASSCQVLGSISATHDMSHMRLL